MNNTKSKAKVFVSCGQNGAEWPFVEELERRLREREYDVSIALRRNSVKPLLEAILRELRSSEYFLFIDFRREPTMETSQDGTVRLFHRGSLFSHQELAIASFLGIDAVGFQQVGVRREGMLDAMQLNCFSFEDARDLPDQVMKTIEAIGWQSDWKAQLHMDRLPTEHADSPRIYHIEVTNLHWREPALDCRGYIHEVKEVGKDTPFPFQKFELKWAGTIVPNVTIMPQECRSFDAFVLETEPLRLTWPINGSHSFADTDKVWPQVNRPGQYELTYLVTSFNFPPAKTTFLLDLNEDVLHTSLTPLPSKAINMNCQNP
jgi:hypothetical protein